MRIELRFVNHLQVEEMLPTTPRRRAPTQKGDSPGITLGEWPAAAGSGTYTCAGGAGELDVSFTRLAPNALYTIWHFYLPDPPPAPYIGTLDLPVGNRGGSQNAFRSAARGNATFRLKFRRYLQLRWGADRSALYIAWHRDGKTHGLDPGPVGQTTHVQLFLFLARQDEL